MNTNNIILQVEVKNNKARKVQPGRELEIEWEMVNSRAILTSTKKFQDFAKNSRISRSADQLVKNFIKMQNLQISQVDEKFYLHGFCPPFCQEYCFARKILMTEMEFLHNNGVSKRLCLDF